MQVSDGSFYRMGIGALMLGSEEQYLAGTKAVVPGKTRGQAAAGNEDLSEILGGEGNDLAYLVPPHDQHEETIQPQGDPRRRWEPVEIVEKTLGHPSRPPA